MTSYSNVEFRVHHSSLTDHRDTMRIAWRSRFVQYFRGRPPLRVVLYRSPALPSIAAFP